MAKVFIDLDDISANADQLNAAFLDINDALTAVIRKDIGLPWLKYHKGMQGLKVIHDFVKRLIVEKRASNGSDMLSFMCKETTESGSLFSDEDIVQHVSFLLFGAHDTTTSALTHVIYRLAVHPEWQDKLRAESQALGKEFLDYEDIDKMTNMDNVFP